MVRICALVLVAVSKAAFGQQWDQMPDFPGTARDDAAAFSHYCKVYVGTGMQVGWSLTNDWWRYDMVQFTWQQVAALPSTPRQYCTAQAIDGIGYLFGGLDATAPLNELWAYDTSTDAWTALSPLPGAGRYACTSFTHESKLYVAGGLIAGGAALSELWEYDPLNDQWTQRTDIPGAARHRATAIGPSDWAQYPLVIGGALADYTPLDEVWQYGPGDAWTARAPIPEARYGLSAAGTPSALVIAGAVDNSTFRSDGYQYDAWADEWAPLTAGTIPDGRRGGASGWSDQCSGWYFAFYGLGLDGTMTRRNDWYRTGFMFTIADEGSESQPIFPVPASDHIDLGRTLTVGSSYASIVDASGKVVHPMQAITSSTLDISGLAPGSYALLIILGDQRRVGHFIKLP